LGVKAGSLEREFDQRYGAQMLKEWLQMLSINIKFLEEFRFYLILKSLLKPMKWKGPVRSLSKSSPLK